MKKIIAIILIAVQLLLCSYTPPNFNIVYKNYESSEPVHDYAGIFDSVYISNYLGRYYFNNDHDWLELSVYSYTKDEDYRYLIGELKERGIEFIALLIKVDIDGNYLDYRIEYRNGRHEALPDSNDLYGYYLKAKPLLESGDYDEAVLTFFKGAKKDISDYDATYKQQEEERKEQYEEQYEEQSEKSRKKATGIIIALPILLSLITAAAVAWIYVRKLKKQLDTITDNVENIYYMNDNKTRFSLDHLPNQSNY